MRNFGKYITIPLEAIQNNNKDNLNGDYVFRVGDVIYSTESTELLISRKYKGLYDLILKIVYWL
jgi:hypothetical protein